MKYFKYLLMLFLAKKRPQGILALVVLITVGAISAYEKAYSPTSATSKRSSSESAVASKSATPTDKIYHDCRVKRLSDGDSFLATCQGRDIKVRMSGLDAPETQQAPWGARSKAFLSNLILKEKFTIEVMDIDRYQRKVARIYLERNPRIDVGLAIIRSGNAIVYRRYNKDPAYIAAEEKAKSEQLGIWSRSGGHQNPEKWRRLNKR